MKLDYNKVCHILKNAVTFTDPPDYEINSILTSENETLKKKVQSDYDEWKKHVHGNTGEADFRWVGNCEIGNLTGFEIIRMFYHIFVQNQFKTGNYIYFTRKNEVFGAMLFIRYNTRICTLPSPSGSEEEHPYNNLFNGLQRKKNRKMGMKCKSEDQIEQHQSRAKKELPKFWITKFAEFDLQLFGKHFFGLSLDIAFYSNTKCFLLDSNPDLGKIPFAACVKLAFDVDQIEKIAELFGAIGYIDPRFSSERFKWKGKKIIETAQDLITQ